MITVEEAVLAYAAAWNENDEAKRQALLDLCWADNGILLSTYEHLVGREALFARIGGWRRTCPQDRAVFTSGIEEHHTWFRFTAAFIRADGTLYEQTALDIGEVGSDGRIVKMITFFGPFPPIPTQWSPHLVKLNYNLVRE